MMINASWELEEKDNILVIHIFNRLLLIHFNGLKTFFHRIIVPRSVLFERLRPVPGAGFHLECLLEASFPG